LDSSFELFDISAEIYKNKYSRNILKVIRKNGNVFQAGFLCTMESVKYLPHINVCNLLNLFKYIFVRRLSEVSMAQKKVKTPALGCITVAQACS